MNTVALNNFQVPSEKMRFKYVPVQSPGLTRRLEIFRWALDELFLVRKVESLNG
jgi:hypothetical protein